MLRRRHPNIPAALPPPPLLRNFNFCVEIGQGMTIFF
jgi:hypothetical protein